MKSLKIALVVMVLVAPFYAQTPGQTTKIRKVTVLPSACTAGDMVVVSGDATYDCPNGSWQKIGAGGSVPDADATTKGKLQLTGDLGGSAASPTTPTALHQTGDETATGKKTIDEVWTKYSPSANVKAHGAKGNGKYYFNASITSGSKNLTAYYFESGDVGKNICVKGAGAAGADLCTTIASYSSISAVTLTDAAGGTVSGAGVWWGDTTDDTTSIGNAIQNTFDLVNANYSSGTEVTVPIGTYFIGSTITLPGTNPSSSNNKVGAVTIKCMGGRQATRFIWTGADQGVMFQTATTHAVPVRFEGCSFFGVDSTHRPIAILWSNGTEHRATDNFFGSNVYEGIRAYNTWLNQIDFNRCYSAYTCIHFGPGGNGPVNATLISNNELSSFGNYGILSDATGSGGTVQNTYIANNCENTPGPFTGCMKLNDSYSYMQMGFNEYGSNMTSGYDFELTGGAWTIFSPTGLKCLHLAGSYNTVSIGNGSVFTNCSGQSYWIKNDGSYGKFIGVSSTAFSSLNSYSVLLGGTTGGGDFSSSALASTPRTIGTAYDWTNGRADVAGWPITKSRSYTVTTATSNPDMPSSFGTAATVPVGTLVFNQDLTNTHPLENNVWWICVASPCATNPLNSAQWKRVGEMGSKVRSEGTTTPGTLAWTVGDWIWKTNPTANGIIAWYCTSAGTPCGNWAPVYGIDVASPPAWGGTTPAAVTGTTINATTKYQLAGADLLDTDGTLAANSDAKIATQKAVKTYADTKATAPTGTGIVRNNMAASELSGDATTSGSNAVTVAKVNGTSVPTNAAADQVIVTTASATGAWKALPSCSNATTSKLLYDTTTHAFSCGTDQTASGAGSIATTTLVLKGDNAGGAIAATAGTDYLTPSGTETLTNKDMTSGTNTFPTFNQNTTGSAAKWTTARNLAGNSVDGSANVAFANKFIVQGTTDAGLSGAQFLGALATGLVKNTTTTGVLSIAVAGTDYAAANASTTVNTQTCALGSSCTVTADPTSAQYKKLSCQPGLGDGLNAIPAGTYLQSTCYNDTGVTVTISGIKCFTDNSGTSTMNATNSAGTALLTGAITCASTFAAGTQSATTTLASGDYIKFTFVADGTSKQTTWVITETN